MISKQKNGFKTKKITCKIELYLELKRSIRV